MRLVFAHIAVTAPVIAATAALLTLSTPVLAETGPDPVPESRQDDLGRHVSQTVTETVVSGNGLDEANCDGLSIGAPHRRSTCSGRCSKQASRCSEGRRS
jgi:hypothetical protein